MSEIRRVLVTGGAGFVGSHLCELMINHGISVICLDNFLTGNLDNIRTFRDFEGFDLVDHDVVEPYEFDVDAVLNLACPASPVHYQADPVRTLMTSVLGMHNALTLGSRLGVPVLQASTSEVYGDPSVHPQREEYWGNVNPDGPRACYDEGKRAAESLMFDFHRTRGTSIKVARIFNTYGPRMDPRDGRVVSNFIVQALQNEDITIYGSGEQTRSFCYVDDLCDGLFRLLLSGPDVTGPINLGNPVEFSVGALAELVIEMTGSRSNLALLPLPVDDPRQRRPDISRAAEQLGWRPSVSLRDGLEQTIAYFDAVLARRPIGGERPAALAWGPN